LIADYYGRVESLPVLSQAKPGEIRAGCPRNPPAQVKASMNPGEVEKLMPGITTGSRQISMPISSQRFGTVDLGRSTVFRLGRSGHALVDSPALQSRNAENGWWLECWTCRRKVSLDQPGGASFRNSFQRIFGALLAGRKRRRFRDNQHGCDKVVAYTSAPLTSIEKAMMIAGWAAKSAADQ